MLSFLWETMPWVYEKISSVCSLIEHTCWLWDWTWGHTWTIPHYFFSSIANATVFMYFIWRPLFNNMDWRAWVSTAIGLFFAKTIYRLLLCLWNWFWGKPRWKPHFNHFGQPGPDDDDDDDEPENVCGLQAIPGSDNEFTLHGKRIGLMAAYYFLLRLDWMKEVVVPKIEKDDLGDDIAGSIVLVNSIISDSIMRISESVILISSSVNSISDSVNSISSDAIPISSDAIKSVTSIVSDIIPISNNVTCFSNSVIPTSNGITSISSGDITSFSTFKYNWKDAILNSWLDRSVIEHKFNSSPISTNKITLDSTNIKETVIDMPINTDVKVQSMVDNTNIVNDVVKPNNFVDPSFTIPKNNIDMVDSLLRNNFESKSSMVVDTKLTQMVDNLSFQMTNMNFKTGTLSSLVTETLPKVIEILINS